MHPPRPTSTLFPYTTLFRSDLGSFDGTWQGKLEVVDGTSNKDKDSDSFERTKAAYGKSPFKLTIHGQRATVYFGETEVKPRSEEHTSELQSHVNLVCRLLLE